MDLPTVTCIMPTLPQRRELSELARECFAAQTYPLKELIEDDSLGSVGAKRNALCQRAAGAIIVHWDDDDWSAPHRITMQVEEIVRSCKAVTGFNQMLYFDGKTGAARLYRHGGYYALGTSLCYLRSWWQRHPFHEDVKRGEDTIFSREACAAGEMASIEAIGTIVARYHGVKQPKPKFKNHEFSEYAVRDLPEAFKQAVGI